MSNPKEIPTHGPITVEIDGEKRVRSVPLSERPNFLTMPIPDNAPAILTGRNTPTSVKLMHFFDPRDAGSKAALHPGFVGIEGPFNALAVFQLLAKIAHGMMFVQFDTSNIRPLLPPVIIGDAAEDWWKVIGLTKSVDAPMMDSDWWGAHQIQTMGLRVSEGRYFVLVDICLFATIRGANIPSPTYRIVAGECDAEPSPSKWPIYQKRSSYF